jgi:hypothetical protein
MMATVDARTGIVYEPPLSDKGSLYVPLDNLSDMEIDLRPNSKQTRKHFVQYIVGGHQATRRRPPPILLNSLDVLRLAGVG